MANISSLTLFCLCMSIYRCRSFVKNVVCIYCIRCKHGVTMFFISFLFFNLFFNHASCIFSSASFYGDSFTFKRLTDFSSESTVSIQFQTRLPNGILLIAVGQHDYLMISLNNGRIQVHINMGQNEGVLRSSAGVQYNDQLWHQLDVIRLGSRVDIRVNRNDVASENLWVNSDQDILKIDLGVFLGGYDESVTGSHFDVSHPFFRGCIINAAFNGVDVLHPLHDVPNQKIIYNIKAGYSRIFRAHQNEAMNMDSPHAYLKYHRWTDDAKGTFDCRVKTLGQKGLILYNSGWKKQTYVGVEMISGTIRGSLNRGSGIIALQSTKPINDGKWHRIKFTFTSAYLEIRIDKNRTKVYMEHDSDDRVEKGNNNIKLKGPLFVGGISEKLKGDHSLKATGLHLSAFPGCVKGVRVNYRSKYFDDILASHDVSVGCKSNQSHWSDLSSSTFSFPTFVIVPRPPVPSVDKISTDSSFVDVDKTAQKFKPSVPKVVCFVLRARNITVEEGSVFDVTSDVIGLSPVNVSKLPLNKNVDVSVRVTKLLSHGSLLRNGSKLSVDDEFSWHFRFDDLFSLHHDGSETSRDQFALKFKLISANNSIARKNVAYRLCDEELRSVDHTDVTLHVDVTRVEDAPVLEIPTNFIFHPVRNARTPLPKQIFNATDSDSSASDILYHVLGLGTGLYIEASRSPGRPVSFFTQSDVDSSDVNFVHAGGPRNARLLLQVVNRGQNLNIAQTSYVVRISAVDLTIKVVNNTGITLVEGESSFITSNHLSSITNAGSSLVDVLYEIITSPARGKVQVLLGEDQFSRGWVGTSSFHQSQLINHRVKYVNDDHDHQNSAIMLDGFAFRISGAGIDFGPFTFNITVLKVQVGVDATPITLRNGSDSIVLSTDFLAVRYSGLENVTNGEIQFVIVKPFDYAELFYRDNNLRISVDDTFTLSDLVNERLQVRILPKSAASRVRTLTDRVSLAAVIRGRYRSSLVNLNLTYIPDVKSIKVSSSLLFVDEGAEATITREHLDAQTLFHRRFLFNVVVAPKSGILGLNHVSKTPSDSIVERLKNVTSFTSRDIIEGRLFYRHDDSEQSDDAFQFRVVPILDGELPKTVHQLQNVSVEGFLNISIRLLNDNSPIRVVNKPFEIARNSQRLLTRNDLWYRDPDVNQDDLDLKYVRRGITNGEIINATSKKKIFEFSQRDILSNNVLFRHKKADYGRFLFWVRDGKHFATGLFVVRASEPYLNVNSSKVLVEKESSSTISRANLQVDTNLVGLESSIKYRVIEPPKYGQLCLGDRNEVSEFTQSDVDQGLLRYRHGSSPNMEDNFTYAVNVKNASTVGLLQFQMFLASLQQPPILRRNRVIVVRQSLSVTIDRSDLRATHQDVRPRDIVFTIREQPLYGYFLLNRSLSADGASNQFGPVERLSTFSQWDVNQGHVRYVQSSNMTFDINNPLDNFTFAVSNGILSLANVEGHIEIVPESIPLRVANFNVGEGRSRVLIQEYLNVINRHFDDFDINIYVIQQPSNGMLARDPGKRLNEFSLRLARAELVSYTHDGSDTDADSFRLQARTLDGARQSDVVIVNVTIIPDNDQAPTIVNNTGLKVWINSITPLSSSELAAVDLDSPPQSLNFKILPPQNGHIAMASLPSRAVSTFTQNDVNKKEVVFVHQGSSTGGFTFQIDDGRNFDNKQIFVITARLLVLTLLIDSPVQVFPSTLILVTGDNLRASTNDEEPRDVTFHVTTASRYGELLKKNLQTGSAIPIYSRVSSFTQSDLDVGLIVYNQSEVLSKWNTTDHLHLNVTSFPAENVTDVSLTFDISYDNYKLAKRNSPIKQNRGAKILEGSSFNLTLSHLDASNLFKKLDESQRKRYALRYRLLSVPVHGRIHVAGRRLSTNDSFLHRFVEQEIVNYTHDDSEEKRDHFVFEAYLQHKGFSSKIHPFVIRDQFNIILRPVNDNPPKLVTKTPHLEAVRGHVNVINSSLLEATDVDSPASQVRFSVIRAPAYGQIKSTSTGKIVHEFTQHHIDTGVLVFEQDEEKLARSPGNVTISDAFYFSLSDGAHRPSYSVFMIKILPVSVRLSTRQILMKQGEVSSLLSSDHLCVTTNGDFNRIRFDVIEPGVAGDLYLDGQAVTSFTYEDLTLSRVVYVMSDLTHDHDHMTFVVCYNSSYDHVNKTGSLHVTILPRISISDKFQVLSNAIVSIPAAVLDASQLANYSSSQPIYDVIEKAKHAELLITGRKKNALVRGSVSPVVFSHDDVTSGHVFLAVDAVNMSNITSVRDQFKFRLRVADGSVQPALAVFPFTILPLNSSIDRNNRSEDSFYTELSVPSTLSIKSTTVPYVKSSTSHFVVTSSVTTQAYETVPKTLFVDDDQKYKVKKVKDHDSVYFWLLPLLIALCVVVFIIVLIVCFLICCKRSKHPTYVKGQESATLKATVLPPAIASYHDCNIDADTVVRITSSRVDSLDLPQQCPTAAVVVTPLRKSTYCVNNDDDDGYYGDGYMSNSMPPDGHLSGMQDLSVASKIATSSPHGLSEFHPDAGLPADDYPPILGADDEELSSGDDSLEFGESDEFVPSRNHSSVSFSLQNQQLSVPRHGVSQYWI